MTDPERLDTEAQIHEALKAEAAIMRRNINRTIELISRCEKMGAMNHFVASELINTLTNPA